MTVEEYWGLNSKPFLNNPDLNFLFESGEFTESYARLIYGLKELKGGLALITGEIGSGKTTLCRAILRDLQKDGYRISLIINPRLTPTQLLRSIAEEFGIEKPGRTKVSILAHLNNLFMEEYERDKSPIILIDEAQLLNKRLLEEIRLLLNYETSEAKLVQLILFGQPELSKKIDKIPQFKQRIAIRYHLGSLDEAETMEYIKYRLDKAGCKGDIFTQGAYKKIYKYSNGIPRIINTLCMNSLFTGFLQKQTKINHQFIDDVYFDFNP